MRASTGSAVPKRKTHDVTNSQQNEQSRERRSVVFRLVMASLPETVRVRKFT